MNFQPADDLSLGLFLLLGLAVAGSLLFAFKKSGKSALFIAGYFALILAASGLALSGIFRSHAVPALPIFLVFALGLAIFYSASDLGARLSKQYSFAVLVGFQAFRFPLELILHHWADLKVVPGTMTWTGQNWDVATGILAIILAPFANKHRAIPWIFQITGTLLLINVFRVVLFSLPLPFSWQLDIPLELPFEFPYVLILPLFVWPAILGHLILGRKLWRESSSR